ncbi:hypothetical protein CEXT_356921 [Caerostris extrusa]|uniref:Uncharacterized protein n=1 Tax=Caerostris extrusa TaxID=172846 RepID=A0AAV4SRZ6_CAEEX|nr:hypothetical protein CEXT_356921 [Caerostris extrusa]
MMDISLFLEFCCCRDVTGDDGYFLSVRPCEIGVGCITRQFDQVSVEVQDNEFQDNEFVSDVIFELDEMCRYQLSVAKGDGESHGFF